MNLIGLTEAAKAARVSYRRAHYWTVLGAIDAMNPASGSGNKTYVDANVVPVMRLLRHLSDALGGKLTTDTMRQIAWDFQTGQHDLGDGVVLTWDPERFMDVAA